jgi:hypothetical protein
MYFFLGLKFITCLLRLGFNLSSCMPSFECREKYSMLLKSLFSYCCNDSVFPMSKLLFLTNISSSLKSTFCEISRLERRDVSFQSPHHLPIQQKTKGRPCRMAARQTVKFQIHKSTLVHRVPRPNSWT